MVKNITGKVLTFYVPPKPKMKFLKALIFAQERVSPSAQRISIHMEEGKKIGGDMDDDTVLMNLVDNTVVSLVLKSAGSVA
jgi:hypothetical protein